MQDSAADYLDYIKRVKRGAAPTVFTDEAGFYSAVQATRPRRSIDAGVAPAGASRPWGALRSEAIRAILECTADLRDYDPDKLERVSQQPGLANTPTGRAYALLASEMRAGRIPSRLPNGRALDLARLLVLENKHSQP